MSRPGRPAWTPRTSSTIPLPSLLLTRHLHLHQCLHLLLHLLRLQLMSRTLLLPPQGRSSNAVPARSATSESTTSPVTSALVCLRPGPCFCSQAGILVLIGDILHLQTRSPSPILAVSAQSLSAERKFLSLCLHVINHFVCLVARPSRSRSLSTRPPSSSILPGPSQPAFLSYAQLTRRAWPMSCPIVTSSSAMWLPMTSRSAVTASALPVLDALLLARAECRLPARHVPPATSAAQRRSLVVAV